jgi:predicted dienelactone hydrolase
MAIHARHFLIFGVISHFLIGNAALAEEWSVGFKNIQIFDPVIQYDIEVAIWYPTQDKAKQESIGPEILDVARDARPLDSSQGLILISHGFSGNFLGHNDTAQFLARLGYVVAAPTHPDLQGLKSGKPAFDPLVIRPRHIQLLIDELLNHPSLKTKFRQSRVGVIGFSLGTYTALTAIGAKPDLSGLAEYCAVNIKDALLCSPQASRRFSTIAPNLISQRDNHIGGAVLLAPAYGPLFSEKSLADIDIPVQLFSAEKDLELDNQYNVWHFEKFISNTAPAEVIKDAGHFVFMAPCSERLKQAVPLICEDSKSVDRIAVHQKLNLGIAKFFDEVLK